MHNIIVDRKEQSENKMVYDHHRRGCRMTKIENLTYEVPEAGAMLGLTRNASYEAAKRGDIPTIRIGRLLRVPRAAFHRMLDGVGVDTSDANLCR
jgi:excisionase family DNA binding protein